MLISLYAGGQTVKYKIIGVLKRDYFPGGGGFEGRDFKEQRESMWKGLDAVA